MNFRQLSSGRCSLSDGQRGQTFGWPVLYIRPSFELQPRSGAAPELDGKLWWTLALAWPVIWFVFRMVPNGCFIDMAIVAIIDIYLLFAVLGGDAAKV
jgi:hypothetical protein